MLLRRRWPDPATGVLIDHSTPNEPGPFRDTDAFSILRRHPPRRHPRPAQRRTEGEGRTDRRRPRQRAGLAAVQHRWQEERR